MVLPQHFLRGSRQDVSQLYSMFYLKLRLGTILSQPINMAGGLNILDLSRGLLKCPPNIVVKSPQERLQEREK